MQQRYHEKIFCTVSLGGSEEPTIFILPDFPDTDTYATVMEWLKRRGYTAIHPRYKGSMQSHGCFLEESPGDTIGDLVSSLSGESTVLLGVGFGSVVSLSVATRVDVDGLLLYDPWWDVELLGNPEEYFEETFKHHHYLYREQRDGLPTSLRHFETMYPYRYIDEVSAPVLAFIPEEPTVPREASEEMKSLLDVTIVSHTGVSMEQCFVQNMDRVYSFVNKAIL